MTQSKFWLEKAIEDLTPSEWESLCDFCSKCCLHKFIEPGKTEVLFTNVVCRYMDMETCKCSDYENRHENVPDCVLLTPKLAKGANWLPKNCAYRLVAEGKDIPWWHPLKTGNPESTRKTGNSVYGKVVSEDDIDPEDLEDMVVDWFN